MPVQDGNVGVDILLPPTRCFLRDGGRDSSLYLNRDIDVVITAHGK